MIWMTTQMEAALMWTSRIPRMGVMIRIESLSLSLKFRSGIKFFKDLLS
jgi:hypothetical protein